MVDPRALALVVLLAASACTTYRDQLARGQAAFEANDHERARALLQDLEPDVGRLGAHERARYAYLRGMSDYRLGHESDARYWLSIAAALEQSTPGALPVDWRSRTTTTLGELAAAVHGRPPADPPAAD